MLKSCVAAAILAILATPSIAQTQTQKNAMNHAAQALAAAKFCDSLQSNDILIATMLAGLGVDISKEPFQTYITGRAIKHGTDAKTMPQAAVCFAGVKLYGAKGENVPNLVLPK